MARVGVPTIVGRCVGMSFPSDLYPTMPNFRAQVLGTRVLPARSRCL